MLRLQDRLGHRRAVPRWPYHRRHWPSLAPWKVLQPAFSRSESGRPRAFLLLQKRRPDDFSSLARTRLLAGFSCRSVEDDPRERLRAAERSGRRLGQNQAARERWLRLQKRERCDSDRVLRGRKFPANLLGQFDNRQGRSSALELSSPWLVARVYRCNPGMCFHGMTDYPRMKIRGSSLFGLLTVQAAPELQEQSGPVSRGACFALCF